MLYASWEVRIVENCDRGLENGARGRRSSSLLRSRFFGISRKKRLQRRLQVEGSIFNLEVTVFR